jgi:hypothetical protein
MGKKQFHWLCGVMRGWFSAKLGFEIRNHSDDDDGPRSQQTSVADDSPRDITNRNQPLLLFHMDPTNTLVWARNSFIGSVVSCGVDFQQNFGSKPVMDPSSIQQNFCGHWQPYGHNKQEPNTLTFPYGFNKHHCMGKEEFHWFCGVMRCWSSAKLGFEIRNHSDDDDGLQQSAKLLWPMTAPGT